MGRNGSLEIHGWSTTTSATLSDIDELAAEVRVLAADVAAASARMRLLASTHDLLASAPLAPLTAVAAEEAVLAATVGPRGAAMAAAVLEVTGLMVAAAAATYRRAEQAADGLVAGSQFLAGATAGVAVTVSAEAAVLGGAALALAGSAAALATAPAWMPLLALAAPMAGGVADRSVDAVEGIDARRAVEMLEAFGTAHPELVQQLTASGGGLLAGAELALPPVSLALGGAGPPVSTREAALALAGLYVDGTPVVTRVPDLEPGPATPPATQVSDLYSWLATDTTRSDLPGRITVNEVQSANADGTARTSYVVDLPGMDSFDLPGRQNGDARENSGNLRLLSGLDSAYTRGIGMAMAMAGVPRGATVALVGHSQGGLAAVELADDPTFTHQYEVTHVLTAGSPISRLPKNPAVAYLSLENEHDIVPRLDGAPTAPQPRVTVATFSTDTGSVGGNHSLQLYAERARELDADAATDADLSRYISSLHEHGFLVGHRPAWRSEQTFVITSDRDPRANHVK